MNKKTKKQSQGCLSTFDAFNGDYDCGYNTKITCDDCKYNNSPGRKDPEAKCNQT